MNQPSITSQPASRLRPQTKPEACTARVGPKPYRHRSCWRYLHHSALRRRHRRSLLPNRHVHPPGGGPTSHRHDFEESFTILQGEIEATFRAEKSIVRAGETLSLPANAPHSFTNASDQPVRVLCICAPAGQENCFAEVGVKVPDRTTPPPKPGKEEQARFMKKAEELAPRYRTEPLKP